MIPLYSSLTKMIAILPELSISSLNIPSITLIHLLHSNEQRTLEAFNFLFLDRIKSLSRNYECKKGGIQSMKKVALNAFLFLWNKVCINFFFKQKWVYILSFININTEKIMVYQFLIGVYLHHLIN